MSVKHRGLELVFDNPLGVLLFSIAQDVVEGMRKRSVDCTGNAIS